MTTTAARTPYTRKDLRSMNRLTLLEVANNCGLDPNVCSKEFDEIVQLTLSAKASYDPSIDAEGNRLVLINKLLLSLHPKVGRDESS